MTTKKPSLRVSHRPAADPPWMKKRRISATNYGEKVSRFLVRSGATKQSRAARTGHLYPPNAGRGVRGARGLSKTALAVPPASAMSKAATHAMTETTTAEMADTYDAVVETHAVIDDVP